MLVRINRYTGVNRIYLIFEDVLYQAGSAKRKYFRKCGIMYQKGMKRAIGLLTAVFVTILISPVLLLISIAVKCESRGPVLFKQKRVGMHKKLFEIYKFRSMRNDTPKDTATHLLQNPESYITRVGKFLRKTSLDELPQLFNIIKGDMAWAHGRPYGTSMI